MSLSLIGKLIPSLKELNRTSIKRIIIYCILLYPIAVLYLYNSEIKMLLNSIQSNVELTNIADAQQRCFNLKTKYGAEAVVLYIYQPSGVNKSYKERVIFATGDKYTPMESMKMVNLYSRSRILEEMRQNSYSLITQNSGHQESSIMKSYDMNKQYIIPLVDPQSKEPIGEVCWIFATDFPVNVSDLMVESQIFSYNIVN